MEIDNDKRATRAKILLISFPFVLLIASSLLALFLVIDTWIPALISGMLVLAGWLTTVVLRLTIVKFRFAEEAITVLYYPISPMTSNFRRIIIDAGNLARFEVVHSLGGLRKDLLLYENTGGQEASYPPVSIRLCEPEMIRKVTEQLNSYLSTGTSS